MTESILSVEVWPLSRLRPYPQNARKITEKAVDIVAASLLEFGWQQPIVADTEGVIVAGHVRHRGALKLGWVEAPVHVARNLTAAQIRMYRLMDNRSHDEATWDMDVLALEIADLGQLSLSMDLTGFSKEQVSEVTQPKTGLTDADAPAEPAAIPVTRRGDCWLLGDHLVRCGDATSPADVGALLGGRLKPVLMATDPPYGVEYDPGWRDGYAPSATFSQSHRMLPNSLPNRARGKVQNDDQADWSLAYGLFPGDVAYVWHAGVYAGQVAAGIEKASFEIRAQIIWRKQHFVFGRGAYHWQHEPCWYAVRAGSTSHWTGDRTQTTVQNLNPMGGNHDEKATGHGTQKPIELMRRPILNHTLVGEAVYDPFLGSGTTLIACEITNRTCYAMDLDPLYVDVAVRRWQAFSGRQATRQSDSQPFDQAAAEAAETAKAAPSPEAASV